HHRLLGPFVRRMRHGSRFSGVRGQGGRNDVMQTILIGTFVFLLLGLLSQLLPQIAARLGKSPTPLKPRDPLPFFLAVASCHNGAASLPGFVQTMRRQNYPADRYKILLLIDNSTDESLQIARRLGVAVYERTNRERFGKTYALNELCNRCLRHEEFDGLVLFD